MTKQRLLLNKIKNKKAIIGVIGLGYVGLPLALALVAYGFKIFGFVRSEQTKKNIEEGATDITDKYDLLIQSLKKKLLVVSTNNENLQKCDVIIICVPTPINKNKKPDLKSLKQVAHNLKTINLDGKLIINESTVAPFTTQKILGAFKGYYFLACSPERIDPGTNNTVENIPKIIGAINNESLELGTALYEQILSNKLIPVSSMEAAEMTKMLENTYRAVNIGLINEFAKLADATNIDILDVIRAASSKWSFSAHYPGIGVGGHCIPVDPYYILEFAQKKKIKMNIVKKSLEENESMPYYILNKIKKVYKKNMKIIIYGLTYKKNVPDLRESPTLILCQLLKTHKIPFTIIDPLLKTDVIKKLNFAVSKIEHADIFVVGADHTNIKEDYGKYVSNKTIIIDGRNYFIQNVGKRTIGIGRDSKYYEKK